MASVFTDKTEKNYAFLHSTKLFGAGCLHQQLESASTVCNNTWLPVESHDTGQSRLVRGNPVTCFLCVRSNGYKKSFRLGRGKGSVFPYDNAICREMTKWKSFSKCSFLALEDVGLMYKHCTTPRSRRLCSFLSNWNIWATVDTRGKRVQKAIPTIFHHWKEVNMNIMQAQGIHVTKFCIHKAGIYGQFITWMTDLHKIISCNGKTVNTTNVHPLVPRVQTN